MAPLSPAACTLEPLRRQGETTGPKALVSFDEPMANSSLLSLPSITAPSAQSCDVMVDSYCGSKPRRIFEPAVVTVPLVQNRSLMPSGTPSSRPASPAATRASATAAMAMARSGVSSTNALSARALSIASTWAFVSSVEEKRRLLMPSRASASVRSVRSVTAVRHARAWPGHPRLPRFACCPRSPGQARGWSSERRSRSLDHLRDEEEVVLGRGRVLDDRLRVSPVRDHVRALLHRHRRDRGHRLDAFDVDLVELLDESQDGVELALQMRDILLGHRNARETRNAADRLLIDGHKRVPMTAIRRRYSTGGSGAANTGAPPRSASA